MTWALSFPLKPHIQLISCCFSHIHPFLSILSAITGPDFCCLPPVELQETFYLFSCLPFSQVSNTVEVAMALMSRASKVFSSRHTIGTWEILAGCCLLWKVRCLKNQLCYRVKVLLLPLTPVSIFSFFRLWGKDPRNHAFVTISETELVERNNLEKRQK
jgi:hypothetical protein